MKNVFFPFLLSILLFISCANPGSGPDGGPYDETPPRIVRMTPSFGAKGEKAKKITIEFDEIVKVENAQEKIIVSPPQIEMPEIKTSGRKISVNLLDTLKENTTYTIDFSDAIVDNNEGNPLGNFTYVFSTGAEIDTLEVAGHVLQAEDLEPVKGMIVGLHSDLADSAFVSKPFDRVARTDGAGHFSIKGVKPGKYFLYALSDMDGDYRYQRGEKLAFSRDTIRPYCFADTRNDTLWADTVRIDTVKQVKFTHYMPDNLLLLAFSEQNPTRVLLKTEREPEYMKVYFTAPSTHIPEVRGLNFNHENAFEEMRSVGNDTITYWLRDTALVNQDTLRILLTYEATDDSTQLNVMKSDTLEFVPRFSYERRQRMKAEDLAKWEKQREKRHKKGDFSQETPPVDPMKIKYDFPGEITPVQNLHFTLPEPAKVDTSGFHLFLLKDSTYHAAPFRLEQDSLNRLAYTLRAEWRPGQQYVLNVDSACMVGLSGKVNQQRDQKVQVATEEQFGSLFLMISGVEGPAFVQLLASNGTPLQQVEVKDGRADFFYLQKGTYYVRLIADKNGNGKWDTGCYAEQKQAEEVYYYPQPFHIKVNWDIEQSWNVKTIPFLLQKPSELVKQKADPKKTPKNRNAERERAKR